ncbi:MAG: TRAP transporter substrate-binding protein DctP [Pseudomonadota bacterium]
MNTSSRIPLRLRSSARRFLLLVLLAVGGMASSAHAVTLKIATISPEGSSWMQALRAAGKAVAERTEGRVKLKFYPGGVQGDDKAVLRKMRVGSLQGGVMTVGILAQAYPDIQLYGLPLVFENEAQLRHVRSQMDNYLLEGLEEAGYVGFGIAEIGFAYMMSQAEIRSVADVQQQKVWVPDGDIGSAKALEAFEITPIPLTIGDVLGGLQTSLIDTIAAPPVGALTLQWHTRLKYVLDVPVLYTYGLLVVGERYFKKISAADQAIVREVMAAATAAVNERSRTDHAAALKVLEQQGLEFLEPRPEATAIFRSMAADANSRFVEEGLVTQPAWDLFLKHKAETP